MKYKSTLFSLIFIALALASLAILYYTDIVQLRSEIVAYSTNNQAISLLHRIIIFSLLSGILSFITIVLGIRLAVFKPRVIVEYIEKEIDATKIDNLQRNNDAELLENEIANTVSEILARVQKADNKTVAESLLRSIAKDFELAQGIGYLYNPSNKRLELSATYAYYTENEDLRSFAIGHGLPGQVAVNRDVLNLSSVPPKYLTVMSGLGTSTPRNLLLFSVSKDGQAIVVFELASFTHFDTKAEAIFKKIGEQAQSLFQGNDSEDGNEPEV
ncbi:MAG: hypothetical protein RIS47_2123 [Bacteroidota bacterium]|jgi:hypothetical protein